MSLILIVSQNHRGRTQNISQQKDANYTTLGHCNKNLKVLVFQFYDIMDKLMIEFKYFSLIVNYENRF